MSDAWRDDDLQRALVVRAVETYLLRAFSEGKVAGTLHTCLGQETVAVALCGLLRESDVVFGTHRSHGHYLAMFDDVPGLLAEVLGRAGGVCGGAGGSQHLCRPGRFYTTGVQGETVAAALGVALHMREEGAGELTMVALGDGSWGQGAVYEALNLACLWRLPLVVAVENNGVAQSTPLARHMAGTIAGRATAFGAAYERVASHDVERIRAAVSAPLARVREGGGPLVVELETARLGPHSTGGDTRDPRMLAVLRQGDWHDDYATRHPEQWTRVGRRVAAIMQAAIADVEARPPAVGPP